MAKIKVIKGDSTKVKEFTIVGYADLSSGSWVGRKVVRPSLDEPTLLDTVMVKDSGDTMFLGYLTPDETDALPVGTYKLIFEIENLAIVPLFRRETQFDLEVTQAGAETTP